VPQLLSLASKIPSSIDDAISDPTAGPALGGANAIATAAWYTSLDMADQMLVASILNAESSIYAANGGNGAVPVTSGTESGTAPAATETSSVSGGAIESSSSAEITPAPGS